MARIIFDALAIGSFVTVLLITLAPARAEFVESKCDTDSACAAYEKKAKRSKTLTGVYATYGKGERDLAVAPDGYFFCAYSKGQKLRLCAAR